MAFQYPVEIPASVISFSCKPRSTPYAPIAAGGAGSFRFPDLMEEKIKLLKMPEDLLTRSVNVGFSGGEKNATIFCKWRCLSLSCVSSMNRIPGWILMP